MEENEATDLVFKAIRQDDSFWIEFSDEVNQILLHKNEETFVITVTKEK